MKQLLSVIILVSFIATFNAAITVVKPTKAFTGTAKNTFVLTAATATDTTADSVIKFATGTTVTDANPAAECTNLGTTSITCKSDFAAAGPYNVFLDGTVIADLTVDAKVPILTEFTPKTAKKDEKATFTITADATKTTSTSTIQFAAETEVTSPSPTAEECKGFESATITCEDFYY